MAAKPKQKKSKSIYKPDWLFNATQEELAEPLKYLVAYVLIYAALRLAGYALLQLLVSGYANQRLVQYIVFVSAVIMGFAAQALEILGGLVIAALIVTLLVLRLNKLAKQEMPKPAPAKPKKTRDYALSRNVVTFGEKSERKPVTKKKPAAKTTAKEKTTQRKK